jgi:pimeloyl-ACP methyl ester carboxylesterase
MARTTRSSGAAARDRLLDELPVADRRLDLGGVSTAVLEGGRGRPIVLLQVEFGAVWLRVIPELVTDHRVVIPDLPGLGASEIREGRPDRDRVLSWLAALIQRTCDNPPVLVGKGPAGALAARFALAHPQRVDRLVLVDSHGLARFRPPVRMIAGFVGVLLHPTERGLERNFRHYCFADLDRMRTDMGENYQWIAAYALDRFGTPSVRTAMRHLTSWLSTPIPSDHLGSLTMPVTLIWGRQDVGMPLCIAEEAAIRYRWPLHVIEHTRDDPALEQPEAFLVALRAAMNQ